MDILVHNEHADNGGGGYYSLPLIRAFSEYGNVITDEQSYSGTPDLFLCFSHVGLVNPVGKKNLRVCYYPMKVNIAGYDGAICLGDWIQHEQDRIWGLRSWVVYPSIELDSFKILPKRNLILNIGTFFYDKAHSKNQHAVLKWFLDEVQGYEIVFMGGFHPRAKWYYDAVVDLAQGHNNVKVMGYVPHGDEFYRILGEAKFLVHANGLTGNFRDEVEHFGIVAIEALASGCMPIVHNSGGCRYIPGVRIWRDFMDIVPLMNVPYTPESLREKTYLYSYDRMVYSVSKMLKEIGL